MLLDELVVAVSLELVSKLSATGGHNLAIRENVNEVRLNVVEDALVVGDHQDATFGLLLVGVDALGNNAQCIHVKAGVGLIHDRELWLQQIKLQNLVALLLATGETSLTERLENSGSIARAS